MSKIMQCVSYWDTILETIKLVQLLKQHEEDPSQYSKALVALLSEITESKTSGEEPTEYWDIIREMILLANAHQKIVQ
ncbi:MAG: hypothetical protein ACXAB4_08315, partial [Candidatus Hodarchaeales archaeon]